MNIPFLIVLTTLAFFGFSDSAFAQKECQDPDPRPKCNPGGGGDDHGDPPAQYCAQLVEGGFDFGKETVIRNNRGNEYNSPNGLYMERPDPLENPDFDPQAWDAVFASCDVLQRMGDITELTVSDDWAISNSGGKNAGTPGSSVLVSFKNAYSNQHPFYAEIEVDLHLVGTLPEVCEPFPCIPQSEGDPDLEIDLYEFWFYVHAHGTDSCNVKRKFSDVVEGGVDDSVLIMSFGVCE